MCILVYVFFSLFPPPCCGGGGEWVGCVDDGVKAGGHSQTKGDTSAAWDWDTIIPPQIPHPHLSSLFQKQKTKQTNTAIVILPSLPQEANVYLTRGDRINLCTSTLTHNLTLRPASLSVQEKCVFVFFCFFFSFFVFFSLFWGSLLLLLGKGKGLFHCVCLYFFNMGTEIGGEVW